MSNAGFASFLERLAFLVREGTAQNGYVEWIGEGLAVMVAVRVELVQEDEMSTLTFGEGPHTEGLEDGIEISEV
jgi:hypothetical protein